MVPAIIACPLLHIQYIHYTATCTRWFCLQWKDCHQEIATLVVNSRRQMTSFV